MCRMTKETAMFHFDGKGHWRAPAGLSDKSMRSYFVVTVLHMTGVGQLKHVFVRAN